MEQVTNHDRLEDVQFEVTLRTGECASGVVAKHLTTQHCHRLALSRVDLAGHDGRARFVLGQV